MNKLLQETSPYLLQHAYNPVHWYAWGEEAFAVAKELNKPVLISIGYSSCHWCHVMAHESFEDEETAQLMNNLFVNVKIDREEYPDLDHIYMDAVQAMTGSGGWPLNVFVTPEKKPFYGGTYFPPVRAYNRASWKEVLINVSQYFTQNRDDVERQALQLIEHLKNASKIGELNKNFQQDSQINYQEIANKLLANADMEYGGFGTAPKFPSTFAINYLLQYGQLHQDSAALQHALHSLDCMMRGGIYDHVGGGFARYSTDKKWFVPHFEKMLYDNALLLQSLSIAYKFTSKPEYKTCINEIVSWLQRDMLHAEGGFYSAQDADSEGVEGKYYTWQLDELRSLLGHEFENVVAYYNVQPEGNWEHNNILFVSQSSSQKMSDDFFTSLPDIKNILLNERQKRIPPLTDDKILLGWNALMSKALIHSYLTTNNELYISLAKQNIHFLLEKLKHSRYLYAHTYKNGLSKIPAYCDDLAYLADALIALAAASANIQYLTEAENIAKYLQKYFLAPNSCLFHYTSTQEEQMEVNKRDIYDGATPSCNAVLHGVFRYLASAYENVLYEKISKSMLDYMSLYIAKHPSSFSLWAYNSYLSHSPYCQIRIVGKQAAAYYKELFAACAPQTLFIVSDTEANNMPSTIQGIFLPEKTCVYICTDVGCLAPVETVSDALKQIVK